jgi:hypothetical protein
MDRFKLAVATNFVLAGVAVFVYTGYALWHGRPMAEEWMGMSQEIGGSPVWIDILIMQSILLVAFCFRSRTDEWKVRLFIAGAGAMGLVFSLILPLLLINVPGVFPAPGYTTDRGVWWYACISCLAYGLVGTTAPEASQGPEAARFLEFSKRSSASDSRHNKVLGE